jgi:hypothetical protein
VRSCRRRKEERTATSLTDGDEFEPEDKDGTTAEPESEAPTGTTSTGKAKPLVSHVSRYTIESMVLLVQDHPINPGVPKSYAKIFLALPGTPGSFFEAAEAMQLLEALSPPTAQ